MRDFDQAQCIVAIPGLGYVNTASFAMYTFSISVLVQAVVVVTFSGAADHGRYRKTLLLSFAIVGAVVTMLFLPINSGVFLLGALWAIIGNVCCASSFVLLNSFLPLLVRWHPAAAQPRVTPQREEYGPRGISVIRRQASQDSNEHQDTDESASLLSPAPRDAVGLPGATSPELQLSTKISSYGMGIGYLGAVTLQTSSMFIVVATGSKTFSLRLVLFLVGLWWLIFTIPAALWLRPRPGPPLASIPGLGGRRRSWVGYLLYSWVNLGRTVMRARRLKDVLLFLAAWYDWFSEHKISVSNVGLQVYDLGCNCNCQWYSCIIRKDDTWHACTSPCSDKCDDDFLWSDWSIYMVQSEQNDAIDSLTDNICLHLFIRTDSLIRATRLRTRGPARSCGRVTTAMGDVPTWGCLWISPWWFGKLLQKVRS